VIPLPSAFVQQGRLADASLTGQEDHAPTTGGSLPEMVFQTLKIAFPLE
jgi:hypothetical protein